MPALFGVIFDADGVLLDSERQSFQALIMAVARASKGKITLSDEQLHFITGRDDATLLSAFQSRYEVDIDPGEFAHIKLACYRKAIDDDPISPAPGALALLDELDAARVPYAVATSAIRAKLQMSLESVGLLERFKTITTADDVNRAKPDPSLFLLAAERLGIEPPRILVFEDAINGIEAANRAGMVSVGIVGTFPREALAKACHLIDSLTEVDLGVLSEWINGRDSSK